MNRSFVVEIKILFDLKKSDEKALKFKVKAKQK